MAARTRHRPASVPARRHFGRIQQPACPAGRDISTAASATRVGTCRGNSKTAVKFGIGHRSMRAYDQLRRLCPNILDTDARTWADANGDNVAPDQQLGPKQNKHRWCEGAASPAGTRAIHPDRDERQRRELGFLGEPELLRRDYRRCSGPTTSLLASTDYTALTDQPARRLGGHGHLNLVRRSSVWSRSGRSELVEELPRLRG